jgi:AraC-like DNA-binding protein
MSSRVPFVIAATVCPFVEFLREAGAPVERSLARARLPTLPEADPGRWIPYLPALSWLDDAVRCEGAPDLGWHVGQRRGCAERVLGPAATRHALGAATPYAGLVALARYIHAMSSDLSVWVEHTGGRARLSHRNSVGEGQPGYSFSGVYLTWVFIDLVRRFKGRTWTPERIFVQRPDGSGKGPSNLARHLSTEIAVDEHDGCGGFEFRLDDLAFGQDTPAAGTGADGARGPRPGLRETLRSSLGLYILDGRPRLEVVAEAVGMSPRALQRALSEEETSYTSLLELARFDLAREWLGERDRPICDIALCLGYSEQSAFTRAFRQWTGTSPRNYRRLIDHADATS